MERIRLTKDEKKVLRHLSKGYRSMPPSIPKALHHAIAKSLKEKMFVHASLAINDKVSHIFLTERGKIYLYTYPKLFNPIPWAKIGGIISAIAGLTIIIGFILGLISCNITIGI